jgi:hypothetical protein
MITALWALCGAYCAGYLYNLSRKVSGVSRITLLGFSILYGLTVMIGINL